jgi:hypothetical protein
MVILPTSRSTMRTLGFRTHLILAIAGAAGLLLSLSRPWYAATPSAVPIGGSPINNLDGPLTGFVDSLKRAVTETSGLRGWEALDHWSLAIAVMAGVAALGALACMGPLQSLGRDLLRYAALAAAGITFWKLFDTPGPNGLLELRYGGLIGGASALVLLTCGLGVANAPLRRRTVTPAYQAPAYPPPLPPVWTDTAGSSAPPGS